MSVWVIFLFNILPVLTSGENTSCPLERTVGATSYERVEDDVDTSWFGCAANCTYKKLQPSGTHQGTQQRFCFKPGDLPVRHYKHNNFGLLRKFCQPGDKCWPGQEDIKNFGMSIDGNCTSCLGLKKFVHINDPDAHVRRCLPYNGLNPDHLPCQGTSWKNETTDLQCDSNPFIKGAYYREDAMTACMTPYQFLNNRNYKEEWMAAFIVTANKTEDIIKAIKFARKFNIGISVMSTGHEFVDRNAGPGPNSLLIRTTCFRNWDPHPEDTIKGYNGTEWKDGYVELGAGHTFGRNFWWDIPNSEGIYALAAKATREMVGGTCHSVGIVGWTMGGGRGWTAPMYGLGVNQLLHVDMVTADGNPVSANYSHNKELFWAVRGGGPGFGVITSLKMKLHKPKCGRSAGGVTMRDCYTIWNVTYQGEYRGNKTVAYVKHLLLKYSNWSMKYRQTWTSVLNFTYIRQTNNYSVQIEGRYFSQPGEYPDTYTSFIETFNDTIDRVEPVKKTTTDKYWCEYFPDPKNTSDCTSMPWYLERWPQILPFMMNSSIVTGGFLDALLETWQPLCEKFPYSPCSVGYQLRGDMPAIDPHSGRGVYATPSAVSDGFNSAAFGVFASDLYSIKVNLTYDQKLSFYHENLAPKLYKFSNSSYFSEAEYTLRPGQWEARFWGHKHQQTLLRIKKVFDPHNVFTCYHCIGSQLEAKPHGLGQNTGLQ